MCSDDDGVMLCNDGVVALSCQMQSQNGVGELECGKVEVGLDGHIIEGSISSSALSKSPCTLAVGSRCLVLFASCV